MVKSLVEYYRYPENLFHINTAGGVQGPPSFFRFGGACCWGQVFMPVGENGNGRDDVTAHALVSGNALSLPFNLGEIADNLRLERYVSNTPKTRLFEYPHLRGTYYSVRQFLPAWLRRHQQRLYYQDRMARQFPHWPVDCSVDELFESVLLAILKSGVVNRIPFIWFWPQGHSSCVTLTHDVETAKGRDFCLQLMALDEAAGLRSSFQLVPEQRYSLSPAFLSAMHERGFEINVHDLNHDGRLFEDRTKFLRRAKKINQHAKLMGARGFRSGVLYRNQDWFDALEFEYDMSVPNVGHLEVQFGGCCTVMPYFVGKVLELPFTTVQDYVLFILWADYSIDLWKRQSDLIRKKHGLIAFLAHPDFICEPRVQQVYEVLLDFICHLQSKENVWFALPGEVNEWWRDRSKMKVVPDGNGDWRIEGPGTERARLAFARIKDGHLVYEVSGASGLFIQQELYKHHAPPVS